MQSKLEVQKKLKRAEERRASQPVRPPKRRKTLTQDALIAEALETEEENLQSLQMYLEQEEERKARQRAAGKKVMHGPYVRWISKGLRWGKLEPSAEADTKGPSAERDGMPSRASTQGHPAQGPAKENSAGQPTSVPPASASAVSQTTTERPEAQATGQPPATGRPGEPAEARPVGQPTPSKETGDHLAEPAPKPTEPAPKPTETAPKPTEPAHMPAESAPKPTDPAPKPTEPAPIPAEAAPKPTEPAHMPAESAPKPTEPAPIPAEAAPIPTDPAPKPTHAPPSHSTTTEPASTDSALKIPTERGGAPAKTEGDADTAPAADGAADNGELTARTILSLNGLDPQATWADEFRLLLGDHCRWDRLPVVPSRNRPFRPRQSTCVVTGLPARYRDPLTSIPYATTEAFDTLRGALHGAYLWTGAPEARAGVLGSGCFAGAADEAGAAGVFAMCRR